MTTLNILKLARTGLCAKMDVEDKILKENPSNEVSKYRKDKYAKQLDEIGHYIFREELMVERKIERKNNSK